MNTSPKVTVMIPVYNGEKYVTEAIDSILAQSFTDFELLLIDDDSTDGSVEIMRSYTDPRIRLVCNEDNLGIPKTLNKGIQLARGEYIAVLDNDDYAYPDRLERQIAFLDRHRDYAVVGSWTATMDEEGRSLRRIRMLPVSPGEVQSRFLFQGGGLRHSSIMARKAVLQDYRYREQYVVCADFDLFVRIARKHKLGNLPKILVQKRIHAGQITHKKAQLMKDEKLEILSAQLTELGMTFTPADLERHFLLRMNRLRFTPDREYLEWAGAWLLKLQKANQRALRYPERPFARVVGETWFKVCRRASAGVGWTAWKHFWQSPLSKGAWSSLRKKLFLFAFRRPPR